MPVYPKADRNPEKDQDVAGGKGVMYRDKLLLGDRLGGTTTTVSRIVLEPGTSLGYHQHVGDNEMYYILEGNARYTENDIEYNLVPGDMAFCEEGSFHGIVNSGDEIMSFMAVIQKPAE